MFLFIASQDIRQLTVGLVENNQFVQRVDLSSSPEEHLAFVQQHLETWGVSLDELEGVYVVTGPGSFTASRVSLTIANGIAFAKELPVVGISNPERASFESLLTRIKEGEVEPAPFAIPVYDRPPGITQSKK